MAIVNYEHNFLDGLSDFWTRFFADSDQLSSLYKGSAILIGQAYLDLLSAVLNISLIDTPLFNREYYKLLLIREDEVSFVRGLAVADNRWGVVLPDNIVSFSSLDNRVIEPTISYEVDRDYDVDSGAVYFVADPTDPNLTGLPTVGLARRALDVASGGAFDDTVRPATTSWITLGIRKGDILRLLDVSTTLTQQTKRSDHRIALVRATSFYADVNQPLPDDSTAVNYTVLRTPANAQVTLEPMLFVGTIATLVHTRLDAGSVRIYAKQFPGGQDVIEGVDYSVDYEKGIINKLTVWLPVSANKIDYTWKQEVWPLIGPVPRYSATGVIRSTPSSGTTVVVRVWQVALWALDAMIDNLTLANNYGSLIGFAQASSENYRAFLQGIFQLYVLGPVVERIESALNVILGLPVIHEDDETLINIDTTATDFNRINVYRPSINATAFYDFPKTTPLRTDLVGGYVFHVFEPLTTAATVTDYIQDPNWFDHVTIPVELFSTAGNAVVPSGLRRTVSPEFVANTIWSNDMPQIGDPGVLIGADEEGNPPPVPGHVTFRRRLPFILMNWYFKYHTFYVEFDVGVFSGTNVARYIRSFDDVYRLVLSAKPAHTYVFAQPVTNLYDEVLVTEENLFQPPIFPGLDPDGPSIFVPPAVPVVPFPFVPLGLFLNLSVGSLGVGDDLCIFQDQELLIGAPSGWLIGDYFHYETVTQATDFSGLAPVTLAGAPIAPRRGRLVMVSLGSTIGSKALVEGIDYSVNCATREITRKTVWDTLNPVNVTFVQLNIGNVVDAPADPTQGDTPLFLSASLIDPANVRAVYDPTAVDWMGNLVQTPLTTPDHRDISMVDRPLTLKIT